MGRVRTTSFAWPGGGKAFRSFFGTVFTNDTQPAFSPYVQSVCDDTVGSRALDHPMSITHIDLSGIAPLNGDSGTDGFGWYYKYTNWYPTVGQVVPVPVTTTLPSVDFVATQTLALSNPSRPSISMPNFLYELKDLPGMIRDIGKLKLLLSRVGSRHHEYDGFAPGTREYANLQLSFQMGWQPLISDLQKLLDFQAKVDKRILVLDNLLNNGGLHRTVGKSKPPTFDSNGNQTSPGRPAMWSEVQTSTGTVTIDSGLGLLIQCRYNRTTRWNMWGSTRWVPISSPSTRYSRPELGRMARDIVFGLKDPTKAIWDSLPWTWLVDWFANVGDFFEATNNSLPCTNTNACVMVHGQAEESWTRIDGINSIGGGYGTKTYETKKRFLGAATATASIPFLGARQLSILGALAIQRSR